MNEANDRDERQVAQLQRKDGSLGITHCIEKAGIRDGAIAASLRIDKHKNSTTSQSQLKDDSRKDPEQTAAHDPPAALPVGKASDASGMPPTEIVDLKRGQDDQEDLHSKKRTKTTKESQPIVEKDLNNVASCATSVEESDKGIERFKKADVLAGRGGGINVHPGNVRFRMLIDQRRKEYLQARKSVKPEINKSVVNIIRRKYGGRFLKRRESDGLWYEIGDARAIEKVGQAFRQKAPKIRKILFGEQKRPQVEFQELRQAQEQQHQIELQHLLEQRHRQQLEQQVQQQQQLQLNQHQMALATASQGTPAAVNPTMLMLVNPLLHLQQQQTAMTNPLFDALFTTNNTMAPVTYPVIQVPTSTNTPQPHAFPSTTTTNNNITPEELQRILFGTGGHVLPKPPPPPGNGTL